MSNCRFCRNGEVVLGPVAGSFGRNHEAAEIESFGHQQAVDHDAPGKRGRLFALPESRKFPPTSQLIPTG